MLLPLHLGDLHPIEQVLTIVLAFGPLILLFVVVQVVRRRAVEEEESSTTHSEDQSQE